MKLVAIWLIGGAVVFGLMVVSVTAGVEFIPNALGAAAAIAVILLLLGSPILLGYLVWLGFQRWRRRSRA